MAEYADPQPIPNSMPNNNTENEPAQFCRLYISSINYQSTEGTFTQYFSQWGEIIDCIIIRNPHTKKNCGYGFITFKRSHMIDDVLNAQPHIIDDRQVVVKRAKPRVVARSETETKMKKIFLGGLKADVEEIHLRDYFGAFGTIARIKILTYKDTGKCRGFGFIDFDDSDAVDRIVAIKEHVINGRKIPNVKKAGNQRHRGGNDEKMRGTGDFRTRNANGSYQGVVNYVHGQAFGTGYTGAVASCDGGTGGCSQGYQQIPIIYGGYGGVNYGYGQVGGNGVYGQLGGNGVYGQVVGNGVYGQVGGNGVCGQLVENGVCGQIVGNGVYGTVYGNQGGNNGGFNPCYNVVPGNLFPNVNFGTNCANSSGGGPMKRSNNKRNSGPYGDGGGRRSN
uniref:RRM domain-containing protein n=1 Tax=Strigamia maritima TaxID=126957 RepID=T1J997_STRMM